MKSSRGSNGIRGLTNLGLLGLILVIAVASGSGCGGSSGSGSSADPNLVAFVTSVEGTGNLSSWSDAGDQIGLAAGDAICQARAEAGKLSGSFVAWLSDADDDAYCRVQNLEGKKLANCGQPELPTAAGPWVRVDGLPFAGTIDQMLKPNYRIFTPVHFDEFGNPFPIGILDLATCHDFSFVPAQRDVRQRLRRNSGKRASPPGITRCLSFAGSVVVTLFVAYSLRVSRG